MRAAPRRGARPPARSTTTRRTPRQNISRRAVAGRRQALRRRWGFCLKLAAGSVLVVLVSLFFIFVHDVFVQSDYFKAKGIQVEGGQRLSSQEILRQAGVREGVNILSVNLSAARRQLLAHPWIAERGVDGGGGRLRRGARRAQQRPQAAQHGHVGRPGRYHDRCRRGARVTGA